MSNATTNMSLEVWIPKQQASQPPPREVDRDTEERLATLLVRVESSSGSNMLTHDADLSDLWDYYEFQIRRGKMSRHKIPAQFCNKRCKRITFAYPSSVICRHKTKVLFAKLLAALEYRYCKDCCALMPKSIMLEMEAISRLKKPVYRRRPPYREGMPIMCPCCGMKTAHVLTLIRKTKMGKQLFSDEGY